jgi:hypothetical protein
MYYYKYSSRSGAFLASYQRVARDGFVAVAYHYVEMRGGRAKERVYMPTLRNLLVCVLPNKYHGYESIVNEDLHLPSHIHHYSSLRYIRRLFRFRSFLLAITIVVVSLIFWNSFPPLYHDISKYEQRLPQHNVSFAQNHGVRYLAFSDHMWGLGWNNVLQES